MKSLADLAALADNARADDWQTLASRLPSAQPVGRLTRVVGLAMEAVGCPVGIGARCEIVSGERRLAAEVVGFNDGRVMLMPLADMRGLKPGDTVTPARDAHLVPDARSALGRVINGVGEPLDGDGRLRWISGERPSQVLLARAPIDTALDVGVTAINALCTVGRGQRMGLFAGSGVGKSVLLGMMSRFTDADVNVVALIGERGREVAEFIHDNLGSEGLARSIVVAAPADDAPLLRLKAAELAMELAEQFRADGKNVLLMMDSLTRYAQAQRELSLAIGEPPATKGYTPSVFAKLPALVERAGNGGAHEGSITGFFTVLTEGDDHQDPIADSARAILDGHIVLSRSLAEQGQYPAVDVTASISRLMLKLAATDQQAQSAQLRRWLATYQTNADLISVGAYVAGENPELDQALVMQPRIRQLLAQGVDDCVDLDHSRSRLAELVAGAAASPAPGPKLGRRERRPGGVSA